MRKKNYKGRCEKQSLDKFTTVCKTYEPLQTAYANILANSKDIVEARCNVVLDDDTCSEYMAMLKRMPMSAGFRIIDWMLA